MKGVVRAAHQEKKTNNKLSNTRPEDENTRHQVVSVGRRGVCSTIRRPRRTKENQGEEKIKKLRNYESRGRGRT